MAQCSTHRFSRRGTIVFTTSSQAVPMPRAPGEFWRSSRKMVSLSQPTHIMVPASLKFGGLGSGNHNAPPGKIVNLPVGGLNKSDALQNSKLDREVSRVDRRPAKSFAQIRDHQGPVRMSRSNFGRPPRSGNPASPRHSCMDPRFDLSSGPAVADLAAMASVAVGSVAAGLDAGEYPAVRQ